MPTHLLDVDDLTTDELTTVLDRAAEIKADGAPDLLDGHTLGMLFEKPSTRTRISFETGMTDLGGHAIFLGPEDIQLGHGEPIKDTARAVSRYVDFLMARMFDHGDVEELAEYASVPVVNGLTDDAHPCQTLADLLTIRERFGSFEDATVAWVGDGNNVCQSFVLGAAMTDLDLTVATPEGYGVDESVLDRAAELGSVPATTTDPEAAMADADVVYTDVWVSMGQEDKREEKLRAFEGFQITPDVLGDRTLMHCLPAHRGEEVTDAAIESDNAIVWDQAENRLHAQNGLLAWLSEQE
ncbi:MULTISPECIES: ornithine carbamoyltransferase [Halomicrobium]|uniref:Ornithine carbamoyltransferase n=2 Tax=Halomicrobium mukohataei TaxID=57705 RepID=C7P000_HALMD|nr:MULTISPECIES: ornithine carbamoyltransferase [Halomicrobium]ACV46908.1 ornithine carbamoyltransferase [Halomicrobium mukohataei DSM 12286]QCD65408.1 ornithine carbamoyltransferase [Halomicrobium mukohataei]QFR20214.1 ornithine carbamoyltransferase [Halomicrobium sp. ZPS1]